MRARISAAIAALALSLLAPLSPPANAAPMAGVGIVTSNLLMYYDYRNYNSYPGSGTTVYDASGNGLTGTLYNSPAFTHSTSPGSVTNGYFSFVAGSSQYQSAPTFNTEFSQGFSISFMADFGASANNWERVIDFGNGNQSGNILMGRSGTSNDLFLETYAYTGANNAASNGFCKVVGAIPVNSGVNAWTMIIAANGASCAVYKNGISQTVTFSGTDISPVDNINRTTNYIGKSNWSGDSYFEGKIYSVAIYNRALSASEATQNSNSQSDITSPNINPSLLTSPENTTSITTLSTGETSYFTLLSAGDSSALSLTSTGVLTFNSSPNYEAPIDSNADNQYGFNVRVMDSNGNWAEMYVQVTVTNLVELASLTVPTLSATPYKGVAITITVTPSGDGTSIPGKISFLIAGKRIPACYKKTYTGTGNSTCTFDPALRGAQEISVTFTPTNTNFTSATSKKSFFIYKRATTR